MGENSIFWPVSPQLCQIVHAVAQCLSRLKIVHALQPMNREGFQHQYILQLSPFTLHLKTTNSSGFPAIEMVTNLIFFFFFFLQSICPPSHHPPQAVPVLHNKTRWMPTLVSIQHYIMKELLLKGTIFFVFKMQHSYLNMHVIKCRLLVPSVEQVDKITIILTTINIQTCMDVSS